MQNKREIGSIYEAMAKDYLCKQGVRIIECNFRCREGEIDLIGEDGKYLTFIEVKFRSHSAKWMPEEAVDQRKQKKICRVADFYCFLRRVPQDRLMRFDVVAIRGQNDILWYRNAFPYS